MGISTGAAAGVHIVGSLAANAARNPDALAFTFLNERHQESSLSNAQLHDKTRRVAANLLRRCQPGQRVAIMLAQDEAYVTLFWACLYAGLVPVPLYPAAKQQARERLARIVQDCGAALVVGDGPGQLPMDELLADTAPAPAARIEAHTLAYLQYSSGSTGAPKGVMISHANIMANLRMLADAAALGHDEVFVNWLPLHHDLGLVNTVLLPVMLGCRSVIGTPMSFIRHPLSWLSRISQYGGSVSGAPNFAYQACVDRLRPAQLAGLDLTRWRVAFNAAEPIQKATLEAFAAALRPAGFRAQSFFAAYGMAEATVFVCGAPWNPGRDSARFETTIGCGMPADGQIVVVDGSGRAAGAGIEGEIWVRGAHVAEAYFGHENLAASPFRSFTADGAGPFFATGDSGVIEDGQLYVLGRIKELIIHNGRNIYPTDIEQLAEAILAGERRVGACAAIGRRQGGSEAALLVLERRGAGGADHAGIARTIAAQVFETLAVLLDDILIVAPGSIQKTSSGKLRRVELRRALEAGEIEAESALERQPQEHAAALEGELADLLTALTGQPVEDANRTLFSYGIASLQIIELLAAVEQRFGVTLTLPALFDHPTVRSLAGLIATRRDGSAPPYEDEAELEKAPLSANQQMLLAIDAWSPGNAAYHLPLVLAFDGAPEPQRLCAAVHAIVARHEILRTAYPAGVPATMLLPTHGFALQQASIDAAALPAFLDELARQPFDLQAGYPVRGALIDAGDRRLLALVFHHIAADGWSLRLLGEQIVQAYAAPASSDASIPFVTYQCAPQRYQHALAYWSTALAGLPQVHSLPLDGARSQLRVSPSRRHELLVPAGRADALKTLCAQHGASLFNGVHALLALALARTSGESDIVIGSFAAGRDNPATFGQVGFLAQTTLLRTRIDLNAGTASLLGACRDALREAQRHAAVSYMDLLRELKPARVAGVNPLFQIALNYHDYAAAELRADGIAARPLPLDLQVARFDLSLDVYPQGEGSLRLSFEYDTSLFEAASIERLARFWQALLDAALADPLEAVQRLRVRPLPSAPAAPAAPAASLYQRFAGAAAASAHRTALRYRGQGLSYAELAQQAERLAACIARHAAPGARVVIFMRRTPAYITAILATLRSDCTYVPLDPDYYQDSVAEKIRFIDPACVLADQDTLATLAALGLAAPLLAADGAHPGAQPLARHAGGACPAYILFTSGSTGSPKAVSMGHAALANLIDQIGASLAADSAAPVVLNYSSIAFDMHFTELFTALLNGGTVVLVDEVTRRDSLALLELIGAEQVSLLNLSYPVLCELAAASNQARIRLPALRSVFSTAQQLKIVPAIRRFFELHPAAQLFNHYGPTETHVVTIAALGNAPAAWPDLPPIGSPIGQAGCFVVNGAGIAEPDGAIGELCVAGVPLADAYYANPAMTAARFTQFDGALRAYRTGDFVRVRNDGALQYLGRKDSQLKLRGLRVDLADIEASLQRCAGVVQAVVVARQSGAATRLVAYLRTSAGVTPEAVAAELRQLLPAYMVPDQLIQVEQFQLNQNAKIDLAQLPAPAEPDAQDIEPPASSAERQVHQIWQRVLGTDGFGRSTNFFEAGGDSMALMAVKRELDLHYRKDFDLVAVYGNPTVAALAALVSEGQAEDTRSRAPARQNLNINRRKRTASIETEI
jgi:amino acid adenylation domain-containing protein